MSMLHHEQKDWKNKDIKRKIAQFSCQQIVELENKVRYTLKSTNSKVKT